VERSYVLYLKRREDCDVLGLRCNRGSFSFFRIANTLFRQGAYFEAALVYEMLALEVPDFIEYTTNRVWAAKKLGSLKSGRAPILRPRGMELAAFRLKVAHYLSKHQDDPDARLWRWASENLGSHPEFDLLAANFATPANGEWLGFVNRFLGRHRLTPVSLREGLQSCSMFDRLIFASGAAEHGELVSICMTTFNSERTVGYAVRSILEQTYQDFELIIVDDASSDGTREILLDLAKNDRRIKLRFLETNSGTYIGRNIALADARGKYFTTMDSDDLAHPQRLSLQVRHLAQAAPSVLGLVGDWIRMSPSGRFAYRSSFRGYSHFAIATLIFKRTEVVSGVGYYDRVRMGADTEYYHRMLRFFGNDSVLRQKVPLAFAACGFSTLTGHGEHGIDEIFGMSKTRREYATAWKSWHQQAANCYMAAEQCPRLFPAPAANLP
jgi:hypothetical protein